MSTSLATGFLALTATLLAYVLPVERVVAELARQREEALPLRLELSLDGILSSWPQRVMLELHPEFGLKVTDDLGGRWQLWQGRVVAGDSPRPPRWLPELEILTSNQEVDLRAWLQHARVDVYSNELGRCGEAVCFVLGGRGRPGQVWLNKDRFEVVRLSLPEERQLLFEAYRSWSGTRFPSEIKILDSHGVLATLTVLTLSSAPDLSEEDFASGSRRTEMPASQDEP